MENEKRKYKGGAEKERERKKKKLEKEASKCKKIDDVFSVYKNSASVLPINLEPEPSSSSMSSNNSATATSKVNLEVNENTTIRLKQKDEACLIADEMKSKKLFQRPASEKEWDEFFSSHPHQPEENSNFVSRKAFYKIDGTHRKWLTYCSEQDLLFCTICLVYSPEDIKNTFTEGTNKWKHIYQRIEEHESSKHHLSCIDKHLIRISKKQRNMKDFVLFHDSGLHELRRKQVIKRREVLNRIIEVIKHIGKRGISYRGSIESLDTLENEEIDHGNFLELIKLISKFDRKLKSHLQECTASTSKESNSVSKGRGNLVSFLSKTTVNYILKIIGDLIKKEISDRIRYSKMFSLQLDTTQDVSVMDQCSIIVRYIYQGHVTENLLSLVCCKQTTGKAMYEVFREEIQKNNINMEWCIGSSTDGASNMQGKYNGFFAHLNQEVPHQIHVWCYAHVLNLVISEVTDVVPAATNLFGLLNKCAVFLRESHKRMDIWREKNVGMKRLNTIGKTRWWSKHKALTNIFGSFGKNETSSYIAILETLNEIINSSDFDSTQKYEAKILKESLAKYETILTALLYARIFEFTSPLSNYLQEAGLDLCKAQLMMVSTINSLKKISRNFTELKEISDKFILWAKGKLNEKNLDIELEQKLPALRKRKKKKMFDEKAADEPIENEENDYKINVHNRIFDIIISALEERFQKHNKLYLEFAAIDPRNYKGNINCDFTEICNVLQKFDKNVTPTNLLVELTDFRSKWDALKLTLEETVNNEKEKNANEENHNEDDQFYNEDDEFKCNEQKHCRNCIRCVNYVLETYNLYGSAYKSLHVACKYILTLSVTQVECERSFSKLKLIKSRLRSSLSQEHLEYLMLMNTEKSILTKLQNDTIIDKLATQSNLFTKLLTI